MSIFIPFLLLTIPGVIAVCVHRKQFIHITCENWQGIMWMYLLYSFAIVVAANFVLWLTFPERSVSFSPAITWTTSHVLHSGFIVRYSAVAVAAALIIPVVWKSVTGFFKKRKGFKIADDE